MNRREILGVAFAAVAVVLLMTPLYLGYLLPYPTRGDGWRLTGIYYAQLVMLGFLLLGVAVVAATGNRKLTGRTAAGIALGSVVAVVVYHRVVAHLARATLGRDAYDAFGGTLITPLSYPGSEGIFVEFFLGVLFVVGVLLQSGTLDDDRDYLLALGVVGLVALPGALSGILALFLVSVSSDLLGVPGVGFLLTLAPLVLGLISNSLLETNVS